MGFIQKSINPGKALGRDLRELRDKAGLTRAAASGLSKVSEGVITILEEERWNEISDPLFFEHMFRTYLRLYSVQPNYYLEKYRICLNIKSHIRKAEELLPRERVSWSDLAVWSRVVAATGLVIFAALIGGYVFYQVRAVTAAPSLVIDQPQEGERLAEPFATIKGRTESDAVVTVNGREASVDTDGSFFLTINIPSGPTIILIQAKKRRGKTAETTRHVFYQRTADTGS